MAHTKLTLTVVSQERQLLSETVDSVTAPAQEGELTVLPDHIPLFVQLQQGVLIYRQGKEENQVVVSKGFLDVQPNNQVIVMVDTAVYAREISLEKAEAAIEAAHQALANPRDRQELLLAEASLKQALLEAKVARSTKKSGL